MALLSRIRPLTAFEPLTVHEWAQRRFREQRKNAVRGQEHRGAGFEVTLNARQDYAQCFRATDYCGTLIMNGRGMGLWMIPGPLRIAVGSVAECGEQAWRQ